MSDPVLKLFHRELERDRLADSYLLIGASRPRLSQLASKFSSLVLGNTQAVTQHPDFLILDPKELGVRGLKVEHIADRNGQRSSLEESLKYKPLQGSRRAVVLLDVDRMTPDAQAAFLKTAEEPPDGTIFFLTAADLSAILPALLSRCRTYRVAPPQADELLRRASAAGIDPDHWQLLLQATGHAEAALDLSPTQRATLLEVGELFENWLRAPLTPPHWLATPSGTLAEQRESAKLSLSACLGWIRAAYPCSDAEQARGLDHLVGQVSQALSDLAGQITPSLVLEQLFQKVRVP